MTIHTRGRPKLPPKLAARARAGLAVVVGRCGTHDAAAIRLSMYEHTISRVTVGAVLRGATGPSQALVQALTLTLGYDPLSLTVAEIAARGAS
jgi:hypothetical protein